MSVSAPSLELLENSPPLSVSLTLTSGALGLSVLLFFSKASLCLNVGLCSSCLDWQASMWTRLWFLGRMVSFFAPKITKSKPDHLFSVIEKTASFPLSTG